MPKIVCSKLINKYHNDLLVSHFKIDKIWELISWMYYSSSLRKDVKTCMRGCDICLAPKTVRYKLYRDLPSLLVPNYWWKDFFMDFVISLPLSADWKSASYNLIFVQNNILRANQSDYWCARTSGSDYKHSNTISRPLRFHYQWLRSDFHV